MLAALAVAALGLPLLLAGGLPSVLSGMVLLAVGIWQIVRNHRRIQGGLAIVAAVVTGIWYAATDVVPAELTGMTPYVTTLLVLAFASQRLRMPAADGQIYRTGEGQ